MYTMYLKRDTKKMQYEKQFALVKDKNICLE